MRTMIFAVLAFLFAGCATTSPPSPTGQRSAPFLASEEEQREYAGLWRGTLDAVDDRLDGPIEFRLEHGAMLLPSTDANAARHILWVRVSNGKLIGAVDTYFDPVRKTDVYTVFEATVTDGSMHGRVSEWVQLKWVDAATFTAMRVEE